LSQAKKIELNIPSEIVTRDPIKASTVTYISDVKPSTGEDLPGTLPQVSEQGHGDDETSKERSGELGSTFISSDELADGRLSQEGERWCYNYIYTVFTHLIFTF